MTRVKHSVVAGYFYPEDPKVLRTDVERYLESKPHHPCPKAIIVPHAGYIYSGPIAGSAYACLKEYTDKINRVVLLGPSHRHYFNGLALPVENVFETPLGEIPVDEAGLECLTTLPFVHTLREAFEDEHCLEVQLPFLQATLSTCAILPIVVGAAEPEQVAEVIDLMWGGSETLIVVSSDLSHYHDYETARAMDRKTSELIEALDWESIQDAFACGNLPMRGLLMAAKHHALTAHTVDLRNSGDTAGDKERVVGYGAFHLR